MCSALESNVAYITCSICALPGATVNEQSDDVIASRDSEDQMTSPEAPAAPPIPPSGITASPTSTVSVRPWTRDTGRSATLARLQRKRCVYYGRRNLMI